MPQTSLLPLFLIVLVDVLGLSIVLPLLPLYGEALGASAFVAALLVPTYSALQLFSSPLLGSLSDRVGRRRVLLISQSGTLIGFLLIASASSLWMVFLGRAVDGATAGNLTVAQAYIADNTPAERRARAFALIGIAFGLGFMLGPALAAYLSTFGLSTPLYLAALLSLTSIVCTYTILPRDHVVDRKKPQAAPAEGTESRGVWAFGSYGRYLKRPVVGPLLGEIFLYLFAFAMFTSGFALYAVRRYEWQGAPFGPREIGLLFAFSGVIGVIVQGGLLGHLVAKLGEARLAAIGLVLLGGGLVLFGYAAPIGPLLCAAALAAGGNALIRPSLTSLLSRRVSEHEQGAVLGVSQSLSSLAAVTAAPLSGWLIAAGRLSLWGWVAGAFCACALLLGRWGSARSVPSLNEDSG
jgi:MFS family permease